LMIEQRSIQVPPETEALLKDFSNESWKDEDLLHFSSTYPNYAVAKDTDDVASAGMSDLLDRWEAARRLTAARLGKKASESSSSNP